ncbi:serine protease, partial [Shewanella xiamenensis]|nr:serine protease [Shewanella xiamenensis]
MDGNGTTAAGDSGAPYSDSEGFIDGIHDWGAIDQETGINASGSRVEYAKDWILETINGWHSPTLA